MVISLVAYNQCGKPGPPSSITVTVNPLPTAVIEAPSTTESCVGSPITLTATPVEGATYQWLLNGTVVKDYTTDNSYAAGASGKYRVRVKSSAGCTAISGETSITIYPLPTATIAEGATATYCAGGSTTLTAQETGTGYTYQWFLNDSALENGTSSTLTVSAEGDYRVQVTRNGCSTMSEPTTVTELPLPTAEITPASSTEFCAGGSVTLNATSGEGYTYRWFAEGSTTVLDSDASFTTSTPGNYYVEVTGSNNCTATSASVEVIVNQLPVATITATGPTDLCAGESVVLNAPEAPDGSTYSYEWRLEQNGSTTVVGGNNRSIEAADPGTYTVRVINTVTLCESTSVGTVVREGSLEFAIFTYTGPTEFCEGGALQLDAILPPESQTYEYRWIKDNVTIVGEIGSSYTVTTTGTYQVEITETSIENECVRLSDPLQVTVNPQPTASISGDPQSLCAEADGSTSFSVSGTFSGGTAVWSSDNTNFAIQNPVYDTTTGVATATVVATGSGDATISLTTSSTVAGCNEAADAVVLNVKPLPTATITPQGETTFCEGGEVVLNAPEGTGYTYQWYLEGTGQLSATGSSYTASLAGTYYVQVTNNRCMVQSEPVTVTVNPLPTATIQTDGPLAFCEGGSVTLNAVSDIGTSFVWFRDGAQVGTGAAFTARESGSYTVQAIVEATTCSNISAATVVDVDPTPDATITATGPTTFCQNESVLLQAPSAPEGRTYSYQWFNGSTQIAVDGTSQTYQATESGNYTVRVTDTSTSLNCSATTSEPVAVTVNPLPTASITYTGSTTLCQGSALLLTGNSDTGTSFIWYRDNVQVATTSTYSATQSGSYTVRAINGNNCISNMSAAVQVTVNPAITGNTIASDQTVCSGGTIAALGQASGTSLAGGATPYQYQWEQRIGTSGAWSEISGATAASYTPPVQTVTTATTFYYRRIVSGGGCSNTSEPVSVTVNPLTPASISGVTDGATYYTGQSSIALAGNPTGGTFTGPGVSGSVSAGFTFSPCAAGVGIHTLTYTYKNSAGCTSTAQVQVNVVQSTYRAVIKADPHPFCQGTNVTYTATVYRDLAEGDIIYPYLVNEKGEPVDKAGNLIEQGAGKFPVANDKYPFPENTPESIKLLAYRFFQPIVKEGVPTANLSGVTYQWLKNDKNERKNDQPTTTDAGLSSQDYYSVRVEGTACDIPLVLNSNRMYSAEIPGYTATLAASPNPICKGDAVLLTATLGTFDWSTANTQFEFVLTRDKTEYILGTVPYSGTNTVELSTDATAVVAGGFIDGDKVFLRFKSDVDSYQASTKCAGTNVSAPITIRVNDIISATATPDSDVICLDGQVSYSVSATKTGPAALSYTWTLTNESGVVTYTETTSNGSITFSSPATSTPGVYDVNVTVSNGCEDILVLLGTLTIRPALTQFTVTGGGSYCETVPENFPITLSGSEAGVDYTLWRTVDGVTDWVQTIEAGTFTAGTPIEFREQTIPGTYTVRADYDTEPLCTIEMTGSATIEAEEPTITAYGDLTVTWTDDDLDQWIVVASEYSESYGANPIFRWYTRTAASPENPWTYTGASTTNTLIVDNPTEDLEIMAEVLTTDGTCQMFVLTNIGVVPLPVEIIYLNASKQGNDVLLEWATASEQDNKGFEVQVSEDGLNYRLLRFVPSKNGNSNTKQVYAFTDKENGKSGTRYYRLKQIDHAGTFEFFGPKVVTFDAVASKVIAFPNPFHDEVTLDIASETDGEMLIVVTDAIGKQLMERKVKVERGFTTEKLKLDAGLPNGLYIIKTQINGYTQFIKMVKE
ncbi:Ig-like domain-containing protein [Pontibacter brevis]